MKIILSRKGFDSKAGGIASPILPSGELCWLPIPEPFPNQHSMRYEEIRLGEHALGAIAHDLTRGKIRPDMVAHLDPDLNFNSIPRAEGWRPIFGQAGAAERHLQNQSVKAGDVFVFFGWFKQVELAGGYRYVRGASDLHVIFGWLQIEQRISVNERSLIPSWASEHPHCRGIKRSKLDSVYVSTNQLSSPNAVVNQPGAGTFKRFDPALCLTAPGKSRRFWQLPSWFRPKDKKPVLTYHKSSNFYPLENDCVLLKSACLGQEFVLDCEEYPEAIDWLSNILALCI